jgi:sec-independent protein translocase protein TatB
VIVRANHAGGSQGLRYAESVLAAPERERMPDLGWQEILIVMVIALIVLGPSKLPEMARTVGKGIREFKGGMAGLTGLGDLGGSSSDRASEPDDAGGRTSGVTTTGSHERASELPPAGLPPAAPPPAAAAEPAAPRPAGTHR